MVSLSTILSNILRMKIKQSSAYAELHHYYFNYF